MTIRPWLRLTLVAMAVGGGFAGFVSTLQSLFNSPGASTLNILLTLVFMGLYGFVTASGLLFVHDPRRTGPLVVALAIQVPSISSSVIVYKFAAGLETFVSVGGSEQQNSVGVHFGWDLLLGGTWRFALQHDNPLRVGVNLAALALLFLLWRTLQPTN
jgi:hypothetical protein